MAKIHHFKDFSIVDGDIRINVDMSRFSDQFNKAQRELDSMVMTSMEPYMPFLTGTFINETKAQSAAMMGTGWVCAGVPPMGRYLYEGKVMVDATTGKGPMKISKYGETILRFRKGAKLKPTERNLTYSNARRSHWFEAAEKADKKMWIRVTKKTAGGG